ncbi:MAG: AAA family ATPase [Gemmatimonadaceae bacterium]
MLKHPDISKYVTIVTDPTRDIPVFVTAIREAQATNVVTGEQFVITPTSFARVRVIGPHQQYYLLARDAQFLLVNRLDVEDSDEHEASDFEAAGISSGALVLTDIEAPKPEPRTSTSYNRRLDEWESDPAACTLQPMVIPKIARAGEMTMLSGKWRDGKSTLMTWICAELSRGGNIFGEAVEATTSHWISFEEHPALVITRFRESKPDATRIHYLDGLMVPPERTLAEFKQLLRETPARIVIVDSLSRLCMRGGDIVSENDNAAWVRVLDDLQRAVRDAGVALVFLHHLSKAGDSRGGTAVPAAMDCAITMRPVSRAPRARKLELRGRTIMDDLTVEKAVEGNRFCMVLRDEQDSPGLIRKICTLVLASEKPSGASVIESLGVQKQKGLAIIKDLVKRGVLLRHGRGATAYLSAGPNFREVLPD